MQKGRPGRRRHLKKAPGRGTPEKEKASAFGMLHLGGRAVIRMLENFPQATTRPLIAATIAPGALVHTHEYDIYNQLEEWGCRHKAVCHGNDEYARNEDGERPPRGPRVCTIEGLW
ncbi:MAG: transposase [Isosphaeraceae bacterium]